MREEQRSSRDNTLKPAAALTIVAAISIFVFACDGETPSPAKDIAGIWVSTREVYFKNQTDSCRGFYSIYDSVPIATRWNITYNKDNLVDIVVTATSEGDRIIVGDSCNARHQYNFPETFHGIVGGTYMVVEKAYYLLIPPVLRTCPWENFILPKAH